MSDQKDNVTVPWGRDAGPGDPPRADIAELVHADMAAEALADLSRTHSARPGR